ncbi:hypothetical protein Ldro_0792, partial [Legionella drozanskii LLAP-1]
HESEQAQLEKELEESKKLLASEQGEKSELTLKVKAIEEELQKANLLGEQAIEDLSKKHEAKVSALEELLKKQTEDSEKALAGAKEKHESEQA